MPILQTIPYDDGTFSWLVAINRQPDGYDIVFKWFDYLKLKSHKINGDIIPDHLHALISFAAIG